MAYAPEGLVTIKTGSGGFTANLESGDRFGRDHDKIGDVNGDGVVEEAEILDLINSLRYLWML